ncbi:hypothetical protein SAMN02745824_1980 [Parasphingorhabdus marina DSM 22363]|uniref:Uncharacterized protein n=2 Tax=Parasphingorhabdus marina TaxID=394732 RepID=A0A1N6EL11_9SPHN|nr:hypothetical protein SAMN02745824_1980 [Parasphingorhabdus marina DSM 22363]
MANADTITAWITFFFGLYAFAAGLGELRQPGFWADMLSDVKRSRALQFLTGMITLVLGATIFLVNPFNPTDWLSILITVLGVWIFLEGVLIFAFGDWFLNFAGKMMGSGLRIWAILSLVLGILIIFVALWRLQVAT